MDRQLEIMVDIGPASSIPESQFTKWTLLWSITDTDIIWNNLVIDEIGGVVYVIGPGGGGAAVVSSFKARKISDGSLVTGPVDATPTSGLTNVGYSVNKSIRHLFVVTRQQDTLLNNGWFVSRAGNRVFSNTGSGAATDNALAVIVISPTGQYIATIEGASKQQIKLYQGS